MASVIKADQIQTRTGGVPFTIPTADGENGYLLKTDGSGNLAFTNEFPGGGNIVGRSFQSWGEEDTGTTTIPNDDTIPQNTEGDEYMSLTYTPQSALNTLLINVVWHGMNNSGSPGEFVVALFKDSDTYALAVTHQSVDNDSYNHTFVLNHEMAAGTTSPITFKVRAGSSASGTTTFNGSAGSREYGGKLASSITITEFSSSGSVVAGFPSSPNANSYIDGLEFNMNVTDSDHDIDISPGSCRDASDTVNMVLATGITKRIDASWVVGSTNGGLDGTESSAGTPDADTLYAIWLIKRSDTGVVDALFSESMTAPTMPTNYDYKRFIGYVWIDSSNNIKPFTMDGAIVTFHIASESVVVNAARGGFDTFGDTGNPVDLSSFLPVGHYNGVLFGAQSTGNLAWLQVSLEGTNTQGYLLGGYNSTADNQHEAWYGVASAQTGPLEFLPIVGDQIYLLECGTSCTNIILLIKSVRLKYR